MKLFKSYLSLVKFSHTLFAMPFAMYGLFLGFSHTLAPINFILLLKVIACMVFARNAAMAFNRLIDKEFDAINPRTSARELPQKIIKDKQVLFFIGINSLLFIVTTYFINTLVFYLSPIALFVILGYSLTKRYTFLCHFFLGLGLSLAPIGAYLTVTSEFHYIPVLVSIMVLLWTAGFDIIYALQDADFDNKTGLHSIPSSIGIQKSLILSSILHGVAIILCIVIGLLLKSGIYYYVGALVFSGALVYQHLIIKSTDLSRINLAFFTLNGFASLVYGTFAVLDLLL